MGCEQSRNNADPHNAAMFNHPHPYAAGAMGAVPVQVQAAPATAHQPFTGGLVGGGYVAPAAGRSGPQIPIHIRFLTGQKITLNVPQSATIADVKRDIEKQTGHPSIRQRLVFGGRQLDDGKLLTHYNVTSGSELHAIVQGQDGLQALLDMYEITLAQADDLKVLTLYDIVFLVDDSGSMNRVEETAGVRQSRWQELRDTVSALIEFAAFFDDDGTDIYFLNREGVEGVTDPNNPQLRACFDQRPRGQTPLTRRLREVVTQFPGKKPLLVVLATDGEPDEGVPDFVNEVRRLLTNPQRDVRLAVMACTQDHRAVRWLNQLDDDPVVGHKIDVCDDYEAEKEEVLEHGRVRQFLISDYYVKALLGPILAKYDQLDGSGGPAVTGAGRIGKGSRDSVPPQPVRTLYGVEYEKDWGQDEDVDDTASPDSHALVGELSQLFLLHKAGALDASQFGAAKAALLRTS